MTDFFGTAALGTIIAALVGSVTTLAALVLSNSLADSGKRRAERIKLAIDRCDAQIGKLYAPLSNLVQQLDLTDDLKGHMVHQDPAHAADIQKLFYQSYFLPIHRKIAKILETQLHLLEGDDIPKSFVDYYRHVASERVFFTLVQNMDEAIKAGHLSGDAARITAAPVPYPEPQFFNDIETGFTTALKRQEQLLRFLDKENYGN